MAVFLCPALRLGSENSQMNCFCHPRGYPEAPTAVSGVHIQSGCFLKSRHVIPRISQGHEKQNWEIPSEPGGLELLTAYFQKVVWKPRSKLPTVLVSSGPQKACISVCNKFGSNYIGSNLLCAIILLQSTQPICLVLHLYRGDMILATKEI